jgi:hypothetical protein
MANALYRFGAEQRCEGKNLDYDYERAREHDEKAHGVLILAFMGQRPLVPDRKFR